MYLTGCEIVSACLPMCCAVCAYLPIKCTTCWVLPSIRSAWSIVSTILFIEGIVVIDWLIVVIHSCIFFSTPLVTTQSKWFASATIITRSCIWAHPQPTSNYKQNRNGTDLFVRTISNHHKCTISPMCNRDRLCPTTCHWQGTRNRFIISPKHGDTQDMFVVVRCTTSKCNAKFRSWQNWWVDSVFTNIFSAL